MFAFMDTIERPQLPADQKSFHPINASGYIENIDEFLAQPEFNNDIELALKTLGTRYTQYGQQALSLELHNTEERVKVEECKTNLKLVHRFMASPSENMPPRFEFMQQVYVKCDLLPVDKVILSIGANTMLEFSLPEAKEFLEREIVKHMCELQRMAHDLDYIKDQLTTTELNISRVFNHGVAMKLQKNSAEDAGKGEAEPEGEGEGQDV